MRVTTLISKFSLIAAFALVLASISEGAAYFVSPTGNDTDAGTETKPWRTVQKAAQNARPGDVVTVLSGVYAERVSVNTSGTASDPITFRGSANPTVGGFAVSGSYIVVDGFSFSGSGVSDYQGAVVVSGNAANCVFKNLTIRNLRENLYGIFVSSSSARNITIENNSLGNCNYPHISILGSGHRIIGNLFSGSTGWDAIRLLASDTLVAENRLIDFVGSPDTYAITHGDFIQSFSDNGESAKNNVIESNILINTYYIQICNIDDEALGNVANWTWRNNIFIGPSSQANIYAPGMKWYNNLFYRCGQDAGTVLMFKGTSARNYANNSEVVNNLFVECGNPTNAYQGWYTVASGITGFYAANNLVVGTGSGTTKKDFSEAGSLNGISPSFLDASFLDTVDTGASGDRYSEAFVTDIIAAVRLASTSAAIKAGANLSQYFALDMIGTTRSPTEKWDLGPVTSSALGAVPAIPVITGAVPSN